MPTVITLATGKWLLVTEGPDDVRDRIVAGRGGMTRFDFLLGDETKQVFVNPAMSCPLKRNPDRPMSHRPWT